MTEDELIELRYYYEVRRRTNIMILSKKPEVERFLKLTGNDYLLDEENLKLFSLEPEAIFKSILQTGKKIKLSGSSRIYVIDTNISNEKGRKKKYFNLESVDSDQNDIVKIDEEIDKFESLNDVINSSSKEFMLDGFRKVQTNFFLGAFDVGQEKAKKLILKKYGNLRENNKEVQ